MRFWAIVAFLPVAAFGVTVETLPASEFADTEVSTNIPFEVRFDAMSRMNFSISLDASPTNCVEVSIGEDANGDGVSFVFFVVVCVGHIVCILKIMVGDHKGTNHN